METNDKEEDDYWMASNIRLRNYQIKLIEKAKKQNSIIFLPTGSGKTLIAVHILCSKRSEIIGPFPEKGKRVFFVSPTKVLVYQLHKILSIHTKFKIGMFTGDLMVDLWSCSKWKEQFQKYEVMVLTGDILRHILEMSYIAPSQISLIVFDECHHAVLQHPFQKILNVIAKEPLSMSPLLLGLTAVLMKSSAKKKDVSYMMNELKSSFRGSILTAADFNEAQGYASKPEETLVYFTESGNAGEKFIPLYCEIINILDKIVLAPPESPAIPKGSKAFTNQNKAKRFKNWFVSAKETLEECGIFCGALSLLYYIILVEKHRLMATNSEEIQLLLYCRTSLYKLRRILLTVMGEETPENIFKYSSNKIQILLRLLIQNSQKLGNKNLSTLIFVRKRATAIIIATLLKKLKESDSDFSFVKPEFIIGSSLFDCDTLLHELNNEDILKQFACQQLNTVICTNVLEEGIDVTACKVVISFDFPVSYSSYFQTRGRARDKSGLYFILIKEEELSVKCRALNEFKQIEEELYRIILNRDDEEFEDEESNDVVNESEMGTFVIKSVYRYCSLLPQDKYSYVSPLAWYTVFPEGKQAFVQLPTNCPLKDVIEGEVRPNRKLARVSAFLKTLNKLKELGEVDENLSPIPLKVKVRTFDYLYPHFQKEAEKFPLPGSRKKKRTYDVKFSESLSECLPQPGKKAYIHVMDFTYKFDRLEREDKTLIQEVLRSPATFAIVSSKKLFKICQFPLFLDLGRIECNLLINAEEVVFSESELEDLKSCHFSLFQKLLMIIKKSQILDNRNKGHSFYISPVKKNELGRYEIDWDVVRCDFCKNTKTALVRYNPTLVAKLRASEQAREQMGMSKAMVPMLEQREFWKGPEPKFVMAETDYKYFVISPTYRNVHPPQVYIVSRFCHDLTPLSPFPRDTYPDYFTYYEDKYYVKITNEKQPLMKVAQVFTCTNFNKPLYLGNQERGRRALKNYDELLVPELCDVYPFDRRYWLKALLIPTAINRICDLYQAEEFRRRIVKETGMGKMRLPDSAEWKPLEIDLRIYKKKEKTVSDSLSSALPLSQLKCKAKADEKFIDIKRNLLEVSVCDLEYLVNFFPKGYSEQTYMESLLLPPKPADVLTELKHLRGVRIPPLKVFNIERNKLGPDLAQVFQALTSSACNDIINYERLENLGDAFLKFAVTIYLFKNVSDNEGVLTFLKGKLVGNRNLLYCGLAKGLQFVLNAYEFTPMFDWNPPLFCLPEELVEEIKLTDADPAVISRWEISQEEQYSGKISKETLSKNLEIIRNYEKSCGNNTNELLPYRSLSDKLISDAVESLIGLYTWEFGLSGGFEILMWLDILPKPSGSYSEVIEKPYQPVISIKDMDALVMNLLNEVFFEDLEETLGYTFRNKALLLEAITHPSYAKNRITGCYQRLEFLGDAVLDVLITSYIYQYCGDVTPGEMTDIRSALVNNITFASLAVRYDFHKYLLKLSSKLNKAIEEFVMHQASRNHEIDDNVLILLEESDCLMAEAVQVPKALGDIFESLAGAIFLDSGNSLEAVWAVYYRLMKKEIESFSTDVPKNSVRLLQEICDSLPFFEEKVLDRELIQVGCTVWYDNAEIKVYGFGRNRKEAKRSAAKFAVKKIFELKK